MGAWSFGLDKQVDLIDALFAVTRHNFQPLTVAKYTTNGERDCIYGFHDAGFVFVSDSIAIKETLPDMDHKEANRRASRVLNARTVNLSYLKADDTSSEMPELNQPLPDNWVTCPDHCYNIAFTHYPIMNFHYELTQRLKVGDGHGELIISDASKDNPEVNKEKCENFMAWLKQTAMKGNMAQMGGKANYNLVSAWRLEIPNQHPEGVRVSIDGELHPCSKIQCELQKDRHILQACKTRSEF